MSLISCGRKRRTDVRMTTSQDSCIALCVLKTGKERSVPQFQSRLPAPYGSDTLRQPSGLGNGRRRGDRHTRVRLGSTSCRRARYSLNFDNTGPPGSHYPHGADQEREALPRSVRCSRSRREAGTATTHDLRSPDSKLRSAYPKSFSVRCVPGIVLDLKDTELGTTRVPSLRRMRTLVGHELGGPSLPSDLNCI